MGARGPAKKPAHLKLLGGRGNDTDSGGRKVTVGPAFHRDPPQMPDWLTAEAKDEWARVVPGLTKLNLLKPEDRAVLAAYCETWAEFRNATIAIQENGSLLFEAAQGTIPHPAVSVRRNAGARLQSLAKEFGLTPSSEQELSGDDDNNGDDNPF